MSCIGIIPARYESSRFPGKPLVHILGKSLLQRTYENALQCRELSQLVVATDDERIYHHVLNFGGKVVMTSKECPTGTDRLAEAYRLHSHLKCDFIVNIQGDEPNVAPETIDSVIDILRKDVSASMSTAAVRLSSEEEALNSSIVKCTIDKRGYALYFSRTLIPSNKTGTYCPHSIYYKHIGIYGYRADFLQEYTHLPITPLQQCEDLEQLKVLEHGYRIKVAIVNSSTIGVDVPEDIKKIEAFLCKQNTSLLPVESAHP